MNGTITDNRIAREKEKSCAKVVKYGYDNTLRFANITDLSNTNYELLVCEKSNFSNSGTCAPVLHRNSVEVSNSSNLQISQNDANDFFSQDEELISILQHLQQNSSSKSNSGRECIGGYFCSDTVFNLSFKVLTNIEKNIIEKGLDLAPIQKSTEKRF